MTAHARIFCAAGLAALVLHAGVAEAQAPAVPPPVAPAVPAAPAPRKVAIFVLNNAGAAYQDKSAVLEAALAGRLGSGDFQVISRSDVIQTPTDQAGALRMGQQLGADFVLVATINTVAANVQEFKDENVSFTTVEYVLQSTYKVLDGSSGGSVAGDDFETAKKLKYGPSVKRNDGNAVNELLRTAATKIAQSCAEKTKDLKAAPQAGKVEVAISCALRDLSGTEISLTDIRVGEDNKAIIGGKAFPVEASASVEVDGILMGTTPAKIKLAPGLHKIRISRAGCEDYVAAIDAQPGLTLSPTLQLTAAGYARWKDMRAFLNGIDANRKLTDAQVKVLEGYAQELRQSGVMIKQDYKSDIKVDTKEGLKFNTYKSFF
jgi:hypothetical protein